jgi:Carboxypeptidase regulatory-like domain
MEDSVKYLSLALGLAVSTWGCSGNPTTPSSAPIVPTRPTSTLSGLVFGMTPAGLAPIEGARVRLEIGSFRADAMSDQNGLYTLSGLYEGSSTVTTTKDGYETDTRKVTISGDVQLDIRVVRRVPHTLSGVVYEETPMGRAPVEGVEIYCDACGSEVGHTWVYSDRNGFYSLSWSYNGTYPLLVRKEGYAVVDPSGVQSPNGTNVTVNGDTRFDIRLVRR